MTVPSVICAACAVAVWLFMVLVPLRTIAKWGLFAVAAGAAIESAELAAASEAAVHHGASPLAWSALWAAATAAMIVSTGIFGRRQGR